MAMRDAASSYGPVERIRRRARPKPKDAPLPLSSYHPHPPTQEERVEWARRDLRIAINRANANRKRDPVLNAVVEGRRIDLDRELRALDRIRARARAVSQQPQLP